VALKSERFKCLLTTAASHLSGLVIDPLELAQNVVWVLQFHFLYPKSFVFLKKLCVFFCHVFSHQAEFSWSSNSCCGCFMRVFFWANLLVSHLNFSRGAQVRLTFWAWCVYTLSNISLSLYDFFYLVFLLLESFFLAGQLGCEHCYLTFESLTFLFPGLKLARCDLVCLFTSQRKFFLRLFFESANDLVSLLQMLTKFFSRDLLLRILFLTDFNLLIQFFKLLLCTSQFFLHDCIQRLCFDKSRLLLMTRISGLVSLIVEFIFQLLQVDFSLL